MKKHLWVVHFDVPMGYYVKLYISKDSALEVIRREIRHLVHPQADFYGAEIWNAAHRKGAGKLTLALWQERISALGSDSVCNRHFSLTKEVVHK